MTELREAYITGSNSTTTYPQGGLRDACDLVAVIYISGDEADLIRRLRKMKAQRHQLAIVQFTDKGVQCREVGRLEG